MTAKGQSEVQAIDDLLATKLEFPFLGSRVISRSRLTRLLQESMGRRACLIVAPTGYGKTTLLGEWLSTSIPSDWRIAWLSLDSYDNDPLRFWSYISASLKKVFSRFNCCPQQFVQFHNEPDNYQLLVPFINNIAQLPYQVCVILDDYQNIHDERIHNGMSFLLDHQPNNLHMVISSRVTPPIPFCRLRAQMQIIDITAADLSFNIQEAQTYISEIMNLDIEHEQVVALQNATEGWIAGLQLAALSLQNSYDIKRLISDLPGGNRQIFEYLTEETLVHQNRDIKDFLLKTAILLEMNAELCDAIMERSDSKEILAYIQKSNLFLVSLDEQNRWFRYHHLFAEVLKHQLRETYPEQIGVLNQKACDWFLKNGYPDKAVSHALEAGDLELAAKIIDTSALQAVIGFDLDKLFQWIGRFSEQLLAKRPRLGIYQALASYLTWRIDKAESILQALEQTLVTSHDQGIPIEEVELVKWEIQAIRACMNCVYGDLSLGIPKVLELRKNHPKKDIYFQGLMTHALAEAYATQGELEKAADEYRWGANFAEKHSLTLEYFYSQSELAYVRQMQGQYKEAERLYRLLLDYAVQTNINPFLAAYAQSGIAAIALAKNDLLEAKKWITEIINDMALLEVCPLTWIRQEWLFVRIADYFLAIDDNKRASQYFNRALQGYRENPRVISYLHSDLIDIQVRLWEYTKKIDQKEIPHGRTLASLNPDGKAWLAEKTAMARIHIAQSEPEAALLALEKLEIYVRKIRYRKRLIEVLVLTSLARNELQQVDASHSAMLEAVRLSEGEKIIRIFHVAGSSSMDILKRVADTIDSENSPDEDIATLDFINRLIASFSKSDTVEKNLEPAVQAETATLSPVVEPISPREMEVLKMIIDGKTTKEIAEELTISKNTAKTHVRSIYRKLGSHNRFALAKRAGELYQMKSSILD